MCSAVMVLLQVSDLVTDGAEHWDCWTVWPKWTGPEEPGALSPSVWLTPKDVD